MIPAIETGGSARDIGHGVGLYAGNRALVHANRFVSPSMWSVHAGDGFLNSRLRQARLERLIEAAWGTLDVEAMMGSRSDLANYPTSICKQLAPESARDYGTIGSVVIDVTTKALHACAGNPCRAEWRMVAL